MTQIQQQAIESYITLPRNIDRFSQDYRAICAREGNEAKNQAYASCLELLLKFGQLARLAPASYVLIGGTAVLIHASQNYEANPQSSPSASVTWRGTDDIDVLIEDYENRENLIYKVLTSLECERQHGRPFGSRGQIPFETFTYQVPGGALLKVQCREYAQLDNGRDLTRRVWNNAKDIRFYGVPMSVASKEDLIKLKKDVNRPKDREDIRLLQEKV